MKATTAHDSLTAGCLEAFRRCECIATAVTAGQYVAEVNGQTIGSHLRHGLDHLLCFNLGLQTGRISYDNRDRNVLLERNPEAFCAALRAACAAMPSLNTDRLSTPVEVAMLPAPDAVPAVVRSTVGRELIFVTQHTIHHVAMAVQLAAALGLALPADLALAYSTAAHRTATG